MSHALSPGRMPRRIVMIALAPVQLLDVVGPAEVFAQAGRMQAMAEGGSGAVDSFADLYATQLSILAADGAPDQRTTHGVVALAQGPSIFDILADPRPLDTLMVCGGEGARTRVLAPEMREALCVLAGRAERTASVCTGAFILAAAGLLDGRRATTHWRWAEQLARSYPAIQVESQPIYVSDGKVWTSAGITAGMDLALAMVERDHGHALALAIARELVMFLRRPGGQSQFSTALSAQATSGRTMGDLIAWMADNLHLRHSVDDLAERAGLSPRQFARVFRREFATSPVRLLEKMRVEAARRRLEEAPHGLTSVAASCGFGGEEAMRRAFLRHLGIPPGSYRNRFRSPCRTIGPLEAEETPDDRRKH